MAAQRGVPEPGVLDPGDQFWLEAMADAVLILSPVRGRNQHVSDFRVEYANAATAELADERTADRLRPGGLIGSRFLNLQGTAATAVITAFREVLSSDVPCAIDGLRYRILRAGAPIDQVRDMRVSRHGDRLLVTLRDVTAREQSEQGVRRSEKSLRALVDGVFDEALMIVDPTGNVLSWNTGAERIFGYTAHRMVGRHYSVLYPRGWPVASPVEDVDTERVHETWQVRRDGSRFWARVSITAIHGENHEVRGFFLVTRDLTEQSEQRRRDLHLSLVRALDDCTDVDAAADAILKLSTFALGATFGELFVARQEQGRLELQGTPRLSARHARRSRCGGGRRCRATRRPDCARAHHRGAGHDARPQRAWDIGAGRRSRVARGTFGDRVPAHHGRRHRWRACVFLRTRSRARRRSPPRRSRRSAPRRPASSPASTRRARFAMKRCAWQSLRAPTGSPD